MSRLGSLVTGVTSYWFLASIILQSVRLSVTITDAPVHQDAVVTKLIEHNERELFKVKLKREVLDYGVGTSCNVDRL